MLTVLTVLTPALWASAALAQPPRRFVTQGDGTLAIKSTKNRHRFKGRYRRRDGRYIRRALVQINRVIGGDHRRPTTRISLRLIEIFSHLRQRLGGRWIVISSGFRSPSYNAKLRAKGRTVAKASLHQWGMAVDLKLTGVRSKRLWRYIKKRRLGGAGYYGGPWVHVDTGPARSWTQGTANVRKGLSLQNKRIIIVPYFDRYRSGERLTMRLARQTAYPIGIERFTLQRWGDGHWRKVREVSPKLEGYTRGRCSLFNGGAPLAEIGWRLPKRLAAGRYRMLVHFCQRRWPEMPASKESYPFEVTSGR